MKSLGLSSGASSRTPLFVQPGLKHQNIPELARIIVASTDVIFPTPPDWFGIKEAFRIEPQGIEQRFGPVPERPPQPLADRHLEPLLWSV